MSDTALAPIVEHVQQAHRAVQHATSQRDSALAERKNAIKQLADGGMSLADIAVLIGISRSRVGLILNDNKVLKPGSRKKKRPRIARPLPELVGEWDGVL